MKKITLFSLIFIALLIPGFLLASQSRSQDPSDIKVLMYKSPNCGCCVKYIPYLKKNGFEVESINTGMNEIKKDYQIPYNMQSCHTSIIEGYFVEGHVPIEAINKLLSEKPDIDGISLPEMPSGSPGMPGPKRELFKIYSLKEGVYSDFMEI